MFYTVQINTGLTNLTPTTVSNIQIFWCKHSVKVSKSGVFSSPYFPVFGLNNLIHEINSQSLFQTLVSCETHAQSAFSIFTPKTFNSHGVFWGVTFSNCGQFNKISIFIHIARMPSVSQLCSDFRIKSQCGKIRARKDFEFGHAVKYCKILGTLTLSRRRPYNIKISSLICYASQWTDFYMIGTSVMKQSNLRKVNISTLHYDKISMCSLFAILLFSLYF